MPQGIEIKTLDDLPGFAPQTQVPGMRISPLTAPLQDVIPVDAGALTPAWDPNEAVSALQNIMGAQREAIKASSDALAANTLVQQRVYDENVQQQNKVIEGYEKLQRIGNNPLSDLFALFDPKTWSKQHQLLEIEKAQLRANQSTMRGQAEMNINNQLPALRQAQVEFAQQGFKNQQDFFSIVKDSATLDKDRWQLRLNAAELRLKLGTERRQQVDDALKAMTVEQAKAELGRAKAGRGDWAGMAGLLEEKIDRDTKQRLDIRQIQQNIRNQEFDLADKQMDSLISSIDFTTGSQLIQDAIAQRSPFVDVGGIKIPLGKMITGIESVRKDTEALTAALVANSSFKIDEKMQRIVTTNSALALTNPVAARNLKAVNQYRADLKAQGLDNDPYALQTFDAFLDDIQRQTEEAAKLGAQVYSTPEAKAGYMEFVQNGAFSPAGALPVVEEAMANSATTARSKFAPAWEAMNAEYARQIQQLNPSGMPSVNLDSNTGSAQLLAWAFRNPNRKLSDIRAEIVQGGAADETVGKVINNVVRRDALKSVLDGLSTAPGPGAAVYLNLVRDPRRMLDANGDVDPAKLATYLAQQTVLNGGKADYLQTFVEGLRTYATQAQSITADPGMTAEDQALITKMYGSNGISTVLSSFTSVMSNLARTLENNMNEAIRQDITGETQRRALGQYDPEVLGDQATRQGLLQNVPSATGIGTAEEIKAIYGTDPRFGSMTPQGARR